MAPASAFNNSNLCPACGKCPGSCRSVKLDSQQRITSFVCERCAHEWQVTEAVPEPLFRPSTGEAK
jgi:protein-arginine kinase activator protein McsA